MGNGTSQDEIQYGTTAADTLGNNRSADTNTYTFGGDGNDIINTHASTDYVYGGDGNDMISDDGGIKNVIYAGAGNDTVVLGYSSATVYGGDGNDVLSGGSLDAGLLLDGGNGDDTITATQNRSNTGTFSYPILRGGAGNDVITGSDVSDTIDGGTGDDILRGGRGPDAYLYGRGDGNDRIEDYDDESVHNFRETDTLTLYRASDTTSYIRSTDVTVSQAGTDVILSFAGGGSVTLFRQCDSSGKYGVETIRFLDTSWSRADLDARCMACIAGTQGQDDTLNGTAAADTFCVAAGSATDTIVDLDTGTAVDKLGFGPGLNATNVRIERLATDPDDAVLTFVGVANTRVILDEQFAQLASGSGVEQIRFGDDTVWTRAGLRAAYLLQHQTGTVDTVYGFDDTNDTLKTAGGDDRLYGLAGNDVLDGGTGNDTMAGGKGNDIFIVDAADVVVEAAGEGTDLVLASVAAYSLTANVENLTATAAAAFTGIGNGLDNVITGNAGDDSLYGLGGNDTLDGGAGADTMAGGTGNDTYYVDRIADVVIEAAGEGTDTVRTSAAVYTLGSNVENLVFTGTTPFTGTGNEIANVITGGSNSDTLYGLAGNDTLYGNAGNDTLVGGAGADSMVGGLGNDIYDIDNALDTVVETAEQGIDLVRTSLAAYTLDAFVENLTATSTTPFVGTGNDRDNVITGNAGDDSLYGLGGNDTLDGGAGADTMAGGTGNDTYYVDNFADVVVEAANEGIDTVITTLAGIRYAMEPWQAYELPATVENLTYAGTSDFLGYGNDLDNVIRGGSGNDVLGAVLGNDTLIGGAGNDQLYSAFGQDRLEGGTGDDIYFIQVAGCTVIEAANEGTDTIDYYNADIKKFIIPDNVENMNIYTYDINDDKTVTGNDLSNAIKAPQTTTNFQVSGLGGNDTIVTTSGNDRLDGGTGADVLTGGLGNDVFVFHAGYGADRIADFGSVAGNSDQIELSASQFATAQDALARCVQAGSDVTLTAGTDVLTIANMQLAALNAGDFLIV